MTLLTRKQAAQALGISLATLRRREGKLIKPVISVLGEHLFRANEVRKLAESGLALPATHRKLTARETREIRKFIARGQSRRDIAERFGVSVEMIAYRDRYNRDTRPSSEQIIGICADLERGLGLRHAAARNGVSHKTASKYAYQAGLRPPRSAGAGWSRR